MALPITGVSVGEVRFDPANSQAYRYIRFVMGGFSGTIWAPNITEFLETHASSASFPTVNVKIGEFAVDPNTGVKFRWTGSEWKLISSIVSVGKSVTSGEIVTGAVETAKIKDLNVTTEKLANASVTSDKIDPAVIRVVQVLIPAASVLTLNTVPVTLVEAPGPGVAIKVENVVVTENFLTAAYATNTTMEFRYTDGSGTKVSADVTALLDAVADKVVSVGSIEAETVLTENAPIIATVATGNPTAGDSDVRISVAYRVVFI